MEPKLIPPDHLVFVTTLSAWFIAQTIKVVLGVTRERRFNFKWFVGTGGMPSSHAAAVSAMASAIAVHYGIESPIFALSFLFAIVVITDAQGVRRASGKQAEILNKLLDDIYWKKKIQEDRLKELLGHTPVQVIAGVITGILVAVIFYLGYL